MACCAAAATTATGDSQYMFKNHLCRQWWLLNMYQLSIVVTVAAGATCHQPAAANTVVHSLTVLLMLLDCVNIVVDCCCGDCCCSTCHQLLLSLKQTLHQAGRAWLRLIKSPQPVLCCALQALSHTPQAYGPLSHSNVTFCPSESHTQPVAAGAGVAAAAAVSEKESSSGGSNCSSCKQQQRGRAAPGPRCRLPYWPSAALAMR